LKTIQRFQIRNNVKTNLVNYAGSPELSEACDLIPHDKSSLAWAYFCGLPKETAIPLLGQILFDAMQDLTSEIESKLKENSQ